MGEAAGIPITTVMMWVLGIGGSLFCVGAAAWGRMLLVAIRDLGCKLETLTAQIAEQDIVRAERFARIESRQERADEILAELHQWTKSTRAVG